MPIRERKCWQCGRVTLGNAKRRFCSEACQKKYSRKQKKSQAGNE